MAPASSVEERLPRLAYVGSGGQQHVFGPADGGGWVVKVPRRSVFRLLSRVVCRPKWKERFSEELGGLVLPFLPLEEITFQGPVLKGGIFGGQTKPGETFRAYYSKKATVHARVPPDAFLDRKFYSAESLDKAIGLLRLELDLLERLRRRGFYLIDFIMKNFAFAGDSSRLEIVDTGMVVPLEALRIRRVALTAWNFRKFMIADYRKLLLKKAAAEGNDPGKPAAERAGKLAVEFARRIHALARPISQADRDPPKRLEFPERLQKEIRERLIP